MTPAQKVANMRAQRVWSAVKGVERLSQYPAPLHAAQSAHAELTEARAALEAVTS